MDIFLIVHGWFQIFQIINREYQNSHLGEHLPSEQARTVYTVLADVLFFILRTRKICISSK